VLTNGSMPNPSSETQAAGHQVTNDIKISMSVSRKVNLGNYESGEVFLSLSDVPVGATQEQVEDALQTSKIVWDVLRADVNKKAVALREGGRS
jgi:hypothetical protein